MKRLCVFLLIVFFAAPVYAADLRCECVRYLRSEYGVNIYGDARLQKPNIRQDNSDVGDVVILKYGSVYHVALVVGYEGEQTFADYSAPTHIVIHESNYKPCQATTRVIAWDDEHIVGFVRPTEKASV